MIKKTILVFCCFVMVLSFGACQNKEDTKNITAVATLDGENIDEACFKYYFTESKKNLQAQYGEVAWQDATFDGKPALEYVKEWALNRCVEDKIITIMAKNDGIELNENDKQKIEDDKNKWIKTYGTKSAFLEKIKNDYRMTEEQFDYMLEAVYYRNHLAEKYGSDDRTKEYYNNGIFKVKHILIPTIELGSNIPLTEDGVKKATDIANLVLSKANAGVDFDSLVAEYTADQDVFYYVGKGFSLTADGHFGSGMVSEFETAAFELAVDGISGIVESPYGYHIIKRYENDDEMYQYAKKNLASIVFSDVLEEWKAQKNLVIDDAVYNSYK